jgi:hypothetical protein
VGSTTRVGLQQNVTVAGQPAYQLTLAPKDSRSLIGQVRIAIAAHDSLPLQVQVFARGASSPAFSVGYTSLSFATPAASNFAFSPPPGAKVKTVTIPAGGSAVGLGGALPNLPAGSFYNSKGSSPQTGSVVFESSSTGKVLTSPGGQQLPTDQRKQLEAALAKSLPASMPKAQRAAILKSITTGKPVAITGAGNQGSYGWSPGVPAGSTAYSSVLALGTPSAVQPTVLGKDWLSVAVLPGSAVAGGGANAESILGALMSASTPVHGSWGSGRLLRTSLLSVLMLSDGKVLAGAVVPSVLYADAAQVR